MAAGKPDFYHPQFTVAIAAGTPAAAPVVTNMQTGPVVLDEVQVRVPPGPAGNVGFRLLVAGQQVLPWGQALNWVIADGELLEFAMGLDVDSQVTLQAYNTDVFAHTLWVRLTTHDHDLSEVAPMPPIVSAATIDQAALGLG